MPKISTVKSVLPHKRESPFPPEVKLIDSDVVKVFEKYGYWVADEVYDDSAYGEKGSTLKARVYRTIDLGHVLGIYSRGTPFLVKWIRKYGLTKFRCRKGGKVVQVAFCEEKNAWLGFSHRAAVFYTIGDRIYEEEFGDENTLFTQHGSQVITTLAEARLSAEKFAVSVA